MTILTPLPKIMVAPNGARRTKKHHPNIPLTDKELVEAVIDCHKAGVEGAHIHIRDENGNHLLDADRYHTLLTTFKKTVPQLYLQVTSEAVGMYEAVEQQELIKALKPRYVSAALREMVRKQEDWPSAKQFYEWAFRHNVQIQHLLYSTSELQDFLTAITNGNIPGDHHMLLFVLGSYDGTAVSDPSQISAYIKLLESASSKFHFDWMLCAFGAQETDCLVEAIKFGGKARIGFENSLWNSDGSLAADNAERVRELLSRL